MNNYKAVIFDMDGVLIDSEKICDITWKKALEELSLSDKYYILNLCRGLNKTDTALVLKNELGPDFDSKSFLERTSSLFKEIEDFSGVPLKPYAFEILTYLKNKGYNLALATSTRFSTMERQLKKLNLFNFFDTFTTGDMVEHSKPHPEIYNIAIKSLNLTYDDCIAVEDSPNGIKSAYSAKLPVIMIPDTVQPSDDIKPLCHNIFTSLEELKTIL